jgi:hypothetical protein
MVANMDPSPVLAILLPRQTSDSPSDTILKLLSDPFRSQVRIQIEALTLAESLSCALKPGSYQDGLSSKGWLSW